MKLFIVLLATVSCCLAAHIATVPAVPVEQSLPEFDAGFASAADSRIINGHGAAVNQFPHQVALRISGDEGASICGGSIISATWVLSAAHCTINARQFVLRFGSLNQNTGGIVQTTFRAINHPQFNPINLNNDISLLPLSSPLTFNAAIRAVRLPSRSQAVFVGQVATVSGWGGIANGGASQALLRWANVRIIHNEDCARTYGGGVVVAHVVCTEGANGHQGVCGNGDSGSALVIHEGGGETTQVGVVAFGSPASLGGCQGGRPSGYMRTTSFLTWINQHTGIPIRG